ncbi:amino acid adenylation domain-containing protein [uncultured Algibacter sp.]|uniref:non-ribosomal peptide synthetase n=1 Tax=uncultured Algibacter sp. TaxID=298659 RepID=UPI002609C94B|nr:amino acid adenylation domain-containing protein [uncultured Algibacter sp.]
MENNYTLLTQSQKLLWIGQELNPNSPMYNMVMTYEIKDAISVPHFKKAFEKLVEKSGVLRSVFELENDEPVQKFLSKIDYDIDFIDFSNETNPQNLYSEWEKERVQIQFDLEKCLFDCVLIKISKNNFIWFINQHHLITDGWSNTIMFSKMSQFYTKASQNELDDIITLPHYKDFVTYCENIKEDGKIEVASKHWEEKFKQFPSIPSLYNKKEVLLDTASKRLHIKLGKERTEKLNLLANIKGIRGWSLDLTLHNIFLTSLFAYMYRVSGQEKLVIGSPTHNRTTKSHKNTIGYFVETFPLITEIEDKETFLSLLQKVQLESNSFLKHAQVGASTAELNRSFNVFFNYINTSNSDFAGASVKTSWVHPGHTDPRHHIRLHVHDFDNSGEIQFYFDLNTQVFNAEKQQEVPQHFLKLIDAFIENHEQKISTVNLITETEISRIKIWNNTAFDYPKDETLLSKFEAQVLKTPNEVAILFENESLTYNELHEKSNQMAHFLIKKDIKKGDIIGVSLERSLEMMIYIYGIIKAGIAYLPIDTSIPSERLAFILKDAKSKILLYNHNKIDEEILNTVDSFHVKTIQPELALFDVKSNHIEVLPNDLAYIIYTSGSTGEPKGVKCHHQGICNRLNWMNKDYPITPNDTFLQKTPITFDVSLWELFWPLQEGARLIIETHEGHKNPDKLIETIKKHKVTNIHFVPSMLNVFSQTNGVENCKSLKRIFCSGEALSVPIVEDTYDKLDVEIYNLYGPTEATVDVTSWHCKKEDLANGIPIGKPVANTQLYILDEKLNQLPIGLKGELYIAGKQVSKGYLNREELSKERFVKDIFSDNSNAKMYKTGDLARYREDGVIEYHGRIDNQIKLRGLRIELGEIEKNIEKHASITQAIVSVDEKDSLIAYYTGDKVEDFELVSLLELRLPEYMIPQCYIHLGGFELLSNGKVNRKKLPKRNDLTKNETAVVKTSYISPRNEIEEIVHDVWVEVLNIEQIGVNVNFLRIGGNSLSAISITSRLKAILELDVSITDVFNYPTIEAYSNNIEKVITELLDE